MSFRKTVDGFPLPPEGGSTQPAKMVATAWGILDKNPEWAGILEHYNLGFPYAWLVHTRAGTLNKKGVEQVEATYTFLLEALGIPESREYHHFLDMTTAVNQP